MNINNAMVLLMVFVLMLCVNVAFEMLLMVSSGDTNCVNVL